MSVEENQVAVEETAGQGHGGVETSPRQATPRRVEHFTPAERAARGKAARAEVPRASHGDWEPPIHRPDPVELLDGAGDDPRPGARSDPPRPHARLAVHLLPRRRLPDGVRPRRRPPHGPAHAALRRRPPVQLRRLRGAGPADGVQPQRLRRDPAGTVRMGREAARRELRGRGPRSRLRREGAGRDQPRGRARLPGGREELRRDAEPRHLVHAPRRRGADRRGSARRRTSRAPRRPRSARMRISPRRARRTA